MRLSLLCSLLLLLGTCVSAQEAQFPAPHLAEYQKVIPEEAYVLSGQISNLPDSLRDAAELTIYTSSYGQGTQIKETATVTADGSFSYVLPVRFPMADVLVSYGSVFFEGFWMSGDLHLELNYEAEEPKISVEKLSGPSGRLTTEYESVFDSINTRPYQRWWSLGINVSMNKDNPLAEKIRLIDSLHRDKVAAEEPTLQNISPKLAGYWRNTTESTYLALLVIAYDEAKAPLPATLHQRIFAHAPQVVNDEANSFYGSLYYRFGKFIEGESLLDRSKRVIAALADEVGPANIDFFYLQPDSDDPNEQMNYIDAVLPNIKTPWVAERLRAHKKSLKAAAQRLVDAAKVSPTASQLADFTEFIAEEEYGAMTYRKDGSGTPEELLANLRAAFPGKHLYLDLWATWCGPCIGEFPSSKELHGAAHDLPVEFLYLCTDDHDAAAESWKNQLDKSELPGTHILVAGELHDALLELLGSTGYPTYLLVSPTGNMNLTVQGPSGLDAAALEAALEE